MKIHVDFGSQRTAVIDTATGKIESTDELVKIALGRYRLILTGDHSPSDGDPIGGLPALIRQHYPKAKVTVTDAPPVLPEGTVY